MVSDGTNDGLASTIVGLNSSGISGLAYNHSDIGGYTTLKNPWYFPNYARSKELFLRWSELNVFTPFFRTHEGNKPKMNHQPYTDEDTVIKFAIYGKMHQALSGYLKYLAEEAKVNGYPIVRHPYLHYPEDKNTYNLKYQFLLGEDVLVLPVLKQGEKSVKGYFPTGKWKYVWEDKTVEGGKFQTIEAPLGKPAVFVRVGGEWSELVRESLLLSIK
jgi:alpha-glucosidase